MADFRERLKAQGGRESNIVLDAEAAKALDSITSRTGETQSAAVCRAVVKLDSEESSDKK
jgi:hypothetical protein